MNGSEAQQGEQKNPEAARQISEEQVEKLKAMDSEGQSQARTVQHQPEEPAALKPNPEYNGKRGHYDGHENDKFDIEDFGPEPPHMHERADYWKKIALARLKRGSYFQKLAAGRGQAALDRQAEKEELRERHMQAHEELKKAYERITELENLLGSSNAGQIGDAVGMDSAPKHPQEETFTKEEVEDIANGYKKAISFLETVNKKVQKEIEHKNQMLANLTSCLNMLDPLKDFGSMGHTDLIEVLGFMRYTLILQAKNVAELIQKHKEAMSEFPDEPTGVEGFQEYVAHRSSQGLSGILGPVNLGEIKVEKIDLDLND